MYPFLKILPLFSIAIVVFLVTYLIGSVFSIPIIGKKELPQPISAFIKLAVGYMAVPTIYSLYFTGGHTIFTGVLMLFLAIVFLNRKEWARLAISLHVEKRMLLIGLAVLSGLVLFQCGRYGFFDEVYFHAYRQDNGIYATVAEYLKITGIESTSPWYQLAGGSTDGFGKVYHYEDFWYFAMVLDFLPERPMDLFNYVFSPALGVIQFFGVLALIISLAKTKKVDFFKIALAAGCVVFTMFVPYSWAAWSSILHINILSFPKVAAVPILVPLVLISNKYCLNHLGAFAFGFIILSNPLFLPTIFGSAVVYYAVNYYFIRKKRTLFDIALVQIAAGYFFLYYFWQGSLDNTSAFEYSIGGQTYLYSFIKNIAASVLRHLIFFLPVYLTLCYLIWRNRKLLHYFEMEVLGLFTLILGFSSLTRGIMSNNFEGFQFDISVQTVVGAFLIVSCLFILKRVIQEKKKSKRLGKALFFILVAHFVYGVFFSNFFFTQRFELGVEKTFVNEAKKALAGKNKIGVAITNTKKYLLSEFNLTAMIEADPRICLQCNFLKHVGSGYWANQLTVPSSLNELKYKERSTTVELSPFFRFMQKLKKENRYTNYEDAQLAFIKTYGVDFVVVENGSKIPDRIFELSTKVIEDPFSKTTLIILK